MGQKKRKVKRLTIHRNAESAPRARFRTYKRANVATSSSRSSSPEIPLVAQRQTRLDNIARLPAPVAHLRNDSRLANTFVADHDYYTRSKVITKNESAEKTRARSTGSNPWDANDMYKIPAITYGGRPGSLVTDVSLVRERTLVYSVCWQHNSEQYGVQCSDISSPFSTLPVQPEISLPFGYSSTGMYFSSSESSTSSLSPPPQGTALAKDFKDPVLVTLNQMRKQVHDGISRMLILERQRLKGESKENGEIDGKTLATFTACQNFGNAKNLQELADAFKNGYRALEENFLHEYRYLGMLCPNDDALKYINRSEEGDDASPIGISISGHEPKPEYSNKCKGEYVSIYRIKFSGIATIPTVIDLQD